MLCAGGSQTLAMKPARLVTTLRQDRRDCRAAGGLRSVPGGQQRRPLRAVDPAVTTQRAAQPADQQREQRHLEQPAAMDGGASGAADAACRTRRIRGCAKVSAARTGWPVPVPAGRPEAGVMAGAGDPRCRGLGERFEHLPQDWPALHGLARQGACATVGVGCSAPPGRAGAPYSPGARRRVALGALAGPAALERAAAVDRDGAVRRLLQCFCQLARAAVS